MKHCIHSTPCCLHVDLKLLGFKILHTDMAFSDCPSKQEAHSRYALHLGCGLIELYYHSYKHRC